MFLRQQWKALSKPDKAHYKANGIQRRNRARSPYNAFCREQRPLLPPDLRNAKREVALGQLWAALSGAERAKYFTPAPKPRPAPPSAPFQFRVLQPPALAHLAPNAAAVATAVAIEHPTPAHAATPATPATVGSTARPAAALVAAAQAASTVNSMSLPARSSLVMGVGAPYQHTAEEAWAADAAWQWRQGYLLGQLACSSAAPLVPPTPWAAEVSSEHELAAKAPVGVAEVKRALTMAQQGMKAARDLRSAAERGESTIAAPGARPDRTGAAEVLADYDTEGSRLMESVAPPRVNGSPAAQQGAFAPRQHAVLALPGFRRLDGSFARQQVRGAASHTLACHTACSQGVLTRRAHTAYAQLNASPSPPRPHPLFS